MNKNNILMVCLITIILSACNATTGNKSTIGTLLGAGGGALLGELDLELRQKTGLAVSVADESLNCVAIGTGKALEYEKQLAHVIDYDS